MTCVITCKLVCKSLVQIQLQQTITKVTLPGSLILCSKCMAHPRHILFYTLIECVTIPHKNLHIWSIQQSNNAWQLPSKVCIRPNIWRHDIISIYKLYNPRDFNYWVWHRVFVPPLYQNCKVRGFKLWCAQLVYGLDKVFTLSFFIDAFPSR